MAFPNHFQDFAPSELNGYPRSDGWWCMHLESQDDIFINVSHVKISTVTSELVIWLII